jgi:hypothetical protein
MAFQPFGYPIDLSSTAKVSDVKAAIRKRWKSWFSMTKGARGWILGPAICLWHDGYDKNGPMLIGWISRDASGTRIRGRAGSDLNGMIAAMVYMPFLIVMGCLVISDGHLRQGAFFLAIVAVFGPFAFWMAHKDRKDALPLVQFLETCLAACGRSRRNNPIVTR